MTAAAPLDTREEVERVWAPGTAIVCLGAASGGEENLAVWQVSPGGAPTGAWVKPLPTASEPALARQLLTFIERRAVVPGGTTDLDDVLSQLSRAAEGTDLGWWKTHVFSPVEVFGAVVRRRQEFENTVRHEAEQNKGITPLEWTHDLAVPAADAATVDDLLKVAGIRRAEGPPVVADALTVARLLRWLVTLWSETEQVKNRRHYVLDAHGPAESLPPAWLAAVHTASTTRLPL